MATTFKQGEDKKISVQVIENGLPTNLSPCTNIKVQLHVNNILQAKYSLIPETDHGLLEVDTLNNNQVNIYVERNESKNFPVGACTVCMLCAFPNPSFSDGIEVREFTFQVGRVAPGCGVNVII
jgi:hypothetical protein